VKMDLPNYGTMLDEDVAFEAPGVSTCTCKHHMRIVLGVKLGLRVTCLAGKSLRATIAVLSVAHQDFSKPVPVDLTRIVTQIQYSLLRYLDAIIILPSTMMQKSNAEIWSRAWRSADFASHHTHPDARGHCSYLVDSASIMPGHRYTRQGKGAR